MSDGGRGFLFVTGGTGHTGSRAVTRLLNEGWHVKCLVRTREHASYLPEHERLETVYGDLDYIDPLVGELGGAAALLNMAHVGFGRQVAEACERAGVGRLISLSSTRRFTKFPDASAERVIAGERAITKSQTDYTILRPSMIYGGARDNNLERVVRWLRKHSWMPLVRGGFNRVQPIFVDDLVEAIVRAVDRPLAVRKRGLTLAGPEPITWKEMIDTVALAMGRTVTWIPVPYFAAIGAAAVAELKPGRPFATRDMVRRLLEDKVFDISEAKQALGDWQPRSFREGVRRKLEGLDVAAGDQISVPPARRGDM